MEFNEALNPGRKEKDVCEYQVYLNRPNSIERLREIHNVAWSIARPWTEDYIWQDEPFKLDIQSDHLSGKTRFGDCIEDEWFIVWILNELSRQCPDTWIRITDTDGDFLLIESAMHLPRWLDPDTASHRTWINSGKLLIIQPTQATKQAADSELSLDEALILLRSGDADTLLHDQVIQDDAFSRIRGYPDQTRQEIHRVECLLPRTVAAMIQNDPALIAPVCIEFYGRDPLQIANYNERSRFLSMQQVNDLVSVSVRFTRTLYAQIKGTRYANPEWYPLPSRTLSSSSPYEAAVTGSKLTCGITLLSMTDQSLALPDHLPSDEELDRWDKTVDSDDYLNVNFEEMERVMATGQADVSHDRNDDGATVKKMVAQLSKFMGGESTFEGAGFSDDDQEDDDDDDDDEEEEDDDDEEGFGNVMQFLKSSISDRQSVNLLNRASSANVVKQKETEDEQEEDDEDSVGDLAEYMNQLDQELATHGIKATPAPNCNDDDDDDDDLKIDYGLAKNMLQSMKGGQFGPASALLHRLGVSVPVDDDGQ